MELRSRKVTQSQEPPPAAASEEKPKNIQKQEIPLLLQPWVNLYRAMPPFYVAQLNVSFTLLSALFLVVVRIFFTKIMILSGWNEKCQDFPLTVASAVSMTHAIMLVVALGTLLWKRQYDPVEKISECPQYWIDGANACLEFCSGYMLQDNFITIGYMYRHGVDFANLAYVFHHVFVSLFMTLNRVYGAGYQAAMVLMFFGEITNPFYNTYLIGVAAPKCGVSNPLIDFLTYYAEFIYAVGLLVMRVGFGPVICSHQFYRFFISKPKQTNLPKWVCVVLVISAWALLIGGIPFNIEAWEMIQKRLT